MTPSPASIRIGPVSRSERIEVLDVLRGMALFGIIASNMRGFNGPIAAYFDHSLMWQEWYNRLAQILIDIFISGKFITLFSFMFGIGFAIQMDRAAARALPSQTFYLRRAGVLLVFGLAHMFFIWWGDILAVYALMAFLVFQFRNRTQRTVLIWSAAFYSWPWLLAAFALGASLAGAPVPNPPIPNLEELRRILQIHSTGSYPQIFAARLVDNITGATFMPFYAPRLLGIFLFGLWVWRQGIVRNLSEHRDLLARCRRWGLIAGLPLNVAVAAIGEIWRPNPVGSDPLSFLQTVLGGVALPALSLCYACTVALAFENEQWRARLRPFGAVGRIALTNYLLQSVLCTTLYYGYGFGLYGKVGPLLGLVPTVLIYAAQVAFSMWWTGRFDYGPMEWLWRRLTYGQLRRKPLETVQG